MVGLVRRMKKKSEFVLLPVSLVAVARTSNAQNRNIKNKDSYCSVGISDFRQI